MASAYYGLNKGQHDTDVVVQSSAPSKDVYLAVDETKILTRQDLMNALNYIIDSIMKTKFPPI